MGIVAFILVLSFLVFIHELGHFLAARKVGVVVEEFSIGFPPKIWSKKVGATEYSISLIPLGGFVRLRGHNFEDENPNDPTNYSSKSIAERFFILVAGPLANIIVAIVFMSLFFWVGFERSILYNLPAVLGKISPNSVAQEVGFQKGDQILAINDEAINTWGELEEKLLIFNKKKSNFTVRRTTGRTITLETIPLNENWGLGPFIPAIIGNISPNSVAEQIELQIGDRVRTINGTEIEEWADITTQLQEVGDKTVVMEIQRNNEIIEFTFQSSWDPNIKRHILGISLPTEQLSYGFLESSIMGFKRLSFITKETFRFLKNLFIGEANMDDLGGPIMIAKVVSDVTERNIKGLLALTAIISLQLAIFNLFPIPALDGGHILMLALEKIKRKPLSVRFRKRFLFVGWSFLMFLIVYVTINDILRIFFV